MRNLLHIIVVFFAAIPAAHAVITYNITPSTTLDSVFWNNVQTSLQTDAVDVIFADGTYTRATPITLANKGHAVNILTLKTAATVGGAVITGTPSGSLLSITDCQNIKVIRLKFTGTKNGYAVGLSGCSEITFYLCQWIEMRKLTYGALGVSNYCDGVIVQSCTFSKIGTGAGAHMIYAANYTERLFLINNTFTDCSGVFIKLRNGTWRCMVYGNHFTSNGNYDLVAQPAGPNWPFIQVAAINDVNPGDEYLGTVYCVTKNIFTYGTAGNHSSSRNLHFYAAGWSPSDRDYWISSSQANTLNTGTATQRRAIMSSELGLNWNYIHFGANTNNNVPMNVGFGVWDGNFPNCNPPWQGLADIGIAMNASGLPTTAAAALAFYP